MSKPESSPETPLKAAGIAGPMKKILLCLTGMIVLMAGAGVGVLLERRREPDSTEVSQADSEQEPVLTTLNDPTAEAEQPALPETLLTSDSTPTPPVETPASSEVPPTPEGSPPMERLQLADDHLLSGNYRLALQKYSALISFAPKFQPAELRLRLGVCEEALGNNRQAQIEYRKVIEHHPVSEIREAAILGQARIWSTLGRNDLASATLLQAILEGANRGTEATRSQIPHQLAVLLADRVRPTSETVAKRNDLFRDDYLIAPKLTVEPLVVIRNLSSRRNLPVQKQLVSVEEIAVVQRYSQAPEEIFVNVRTNRVTALELVRRVANKTGWIVQLTEEARLRLQEHTVQPDCLDLPLALVLDAILEPYEMIWRTTDEAIQILPAKQAATDEIDDYREQAALRTLRFACTFAPDHPWTAASYLELGRVSAHSGSLEVAGHYISKMMDLFPRSEFLSIAWFNLGKIEIRQGHLQEALTAFYRAADTMSGHPLEPISYLYAGRVHLENDDVRKSISPLTRSLVLAEGTRFEAMTTLQLASAYLLLQHYQRANEILIEHQHSFEGSSIRDHAAVLSSLIRYRAASDEHDQFRAGTSLVGALTTFQMENCFGGHWPYLVGMAYRDTGMAQEEIAVFRACLQRSYAYPMQNRIRLQLLDDAPDQLADLQQPVDPTSQQMTEFQFRAKLTEAEADFQREAMEAALQTTRELTHHPEVPEAIRREALRLMGRIYQSLGEHQAAVQCFTGVVPAGNEPPSSLPTATLPIPVRGVQ